MKKICSTLIISALILGTFACKNKQKEKPSKPVTTVVQKPVKDSTKVDTLKNVVKEEVKEIVVPKEDKYFLIAGSFQSRENAEVFKSQLEQQGYQSSIIERRRGPNNEFYKVSYMAFHDKKEAYSELRKARNTSEYYNAWLLVKR